MIIVSREIAKAIYPNYPYLISIGEIESDPLPKIGSYTGQLLRFEFDDIEHAGGPHGYYGATLEQIQSLVDFAKQVPVDADILIHCGQGISRSTAAAIIVLTVQGYEDPIYKFKSIIQESVKLGYRDMENESPHPNRWMLHLADQILDTDLVDQVQDMLDCYIRRRDYSCTS